MANLADDSLDPNLASLIGHSAVPAGIVAAVRKPNGARFYKCALQVNPFAYAVRHAKNIPYQNEREYNAALVAACLREGVELVAITDHFRIATAGTLAEALVAAGINVLPGFEASSNEGVHLLCLFPSSASIEELERTIGACGVTDLAAESPQSDKTCEQLLDFISKKGGIAIAAHACSSNGLLVTLRGQSRARVWRCEDLLAIALPGSRDGTPDGCRDIVANKNPDFSRPRAIAVINANDVSDPASLSDPSTTTWIKMTSPTIEGLRQAFLDWQSRIRLNSDSKPGPHTELIAASWAGGLLDGQCLRFNEGLNVFVGGRGAGKSTLIESLRYAFELSPKGDEAKRTHDSMVKSLLGQGASVSVLVRSPLPSPQYYLIERIYGNRARVRDQHGELLQNVRLSSILGTLEAYGQHEISELTRYPEKLAQLLRRFTEPTADATATKRELKEELERSRTAVAAEVAEIGRVEEALAALPTLKEHLKRFAAAGLDAKLKDKTLIDREARLFEEAEKTVEVADELGTDVIADGEAEEAPGDDDDEELPNAALIGKLDGVQSKLLAKIKLAGQAIKAAAQEAKRAVQTVKAEWIPKQQAAEELYKKALRELKAEGHDASRFAAYKDQAERLKPKELELKTRKRSSSATSERSARTARQMGQCEGAGFPRTTKSGPQGIEAAGGSRSGERSSQRIFGSARGRTSKALLRQYQPGSRAPTRHGRTKFNGIGCGHRRRLDRPRKDIWFLAGFCGTHYSRRRCSCP